MGHGINASESEQRDPGEPVPQPAPRDVLLVACLCRVFDREFDALIAAHTCECDCFACYDIRGMSYYVNDMIQSFVDDEYAPESYEKWPLLDAMQAWLEEKFGASYEPGGELLETYTLPRDKSSRLPASDYVVEVRRDPPAVEKCLVCLIAMHAALGENEESAAWHWQWMLTNGIERLEAGINRPSRMKGIAEELTAFMDANMPSVAQRRAYVKRELAEDVAKIVADEPLTVLA